MSDIQDRQDSETFRGIPLRRLVWTAWTLVMLGGAFTYAWKAADSRSAFVRWRHQVLELPHGVNIWDRYYFPNPPILPLMLFPLLALPPVIGALIWYVLKVGMVVWSTWTLAKMARGPNGPPLPAWGLGIILAMSLRPILSDLQHGNINLLILFLVVAALQLWRERRDGLAGLALALAIATKVTPALFVPYFLYKRSWRAVASCLLGLVLFLLVIPSAVLGPRFNWECLMEWRHNIISPFVEGDEIKSTQEVNQSMVGVLTRLLTESKELAEHSNGGTAHDLNLVAWDKEFVATLVKGISLGLVALLAWFCRTRADRRDDPRWLGEFSLVVLTMLFVSERSWKHHYVTILIPLVYLVYHLFRAAMSRRERVLIGAALAASAVLMASTSDGVGGHFADGLGHEIALFYGMFLWSAVILYALVAWRVEVLRRAEPAAIFEAAPTPRATPSPHVRSAAGARAKI